VDRSGVIVGDEGEGRLEIPADHLGALKRPQLDAEQSAQPGCGRLLVASSLLQATLHGVRDGNLSILDEVWDVLDGEDLLYAVEADDPSLSALLRQPVDRFPQLLLERLLLRQLFHLVVVRVLQHATVVGLAAGLATRIIVDRILVGCTLSSFSTCQDTSTI